MATSEDVLVEIQDVNDSDYEIEIIDDADDLEDDNTDENQSETENSEQQKTSTNQTDNLSLEAFKTKWNVSSDQEAFKKIKELESHVGKLQNENKELREISDGVAEAGKRLKQVNDPSLNSIVDRLAPVFEPVERIVEQRAREAQDELALDHFLSRVPEASIAKEWLRDKGKIYTATDYDTIWLTQGKDYLEGLGRGVESEVARQKAAVGSTISSESTKNSLRLSPKQIEMARRFGHDPKEVYKK